MTRLIDLTDQIFGVWTVLRRDGTAKGHPLWLCRCACGAEHRREAYVLRAGRTRGCADCDRKRRREQAEQDRETRAARVRQRNREAMRAMREDPILAEKGRSRDRERYAARRQGLRLPDQRRRNWRAMTPQPIGSAR